MIKLKDIVNEDLFGSTNKMKKHEALLISAIVEFMKKKYNLTSKIIIKKKEKKGMFGDVVLNDNSINKNKFYLHYNPNAYHPIMIQSLIHELIHVKQISKKELQPSSDYKSLMWKKKEYITVRDYNKLMKKGFSPEYKKLPWENEAYSKMKSLYKPFLNSPEYKNLKGKDKTLDYIIDNI